MWTVLWRQRGVIELKNSNTHVIFSRLGRGRLIRIRSGGDECDMGRTAFNRYVDKYFASHKEAILTALLY